ARRAGLGVGGGDPSTGPGRPRSPQAGRVLRRCCPSSTRPASSSSIRVM
ncbi:MAG: hypothetical protein AVDCRST_MAG10-249, partial [uncultured Acidimicrobiales bacterium]